MLFAYQIEMFSNLNSCPEDFAYGFFIIPSEIRDSVMIGFETFQKPHHFNVPAALFFQVTRIPYLVHIPVNEKLKQVGRMISRAAIFRKVSPESVIFNGKTIHKKVNYPDIIVWADRLIK